MAIVKHGDMPSSGPHDVIHFVDAAERTAQLAAPVLNQLSTLDTAPATIWCWNGTAWVAAAPANSVALMTHVTIPNVPSSVVADDQIIVGVMPATTLPYPVVCIATVALAVGAAPAPAIWRGSVYATSQSAIVSEMPPSPYGVTAPGGSFTTVTILARWSIPAGQQIGFRVQMSIVSMVGGPVNTAGKAEAIWYTS